MHDQVWISTDRAGEVRVCGRGQREVAQVLFGIARLLQASQHQEAEDSLFRLARDFLRKLLVHARRDVYLFRDLDFTDALAGAVSGAAVGLHLHAMNGERTHAERVSESSGDGFEVVDAFRVRLFVDAIEAGDAARLEMVRYRLVGREHELLDDAVRDVALGARDGAHQSEFFELDDGLRQIEVDRSAALAFAVEDLLQIAHELEHRDQRGIAGELGFVAFEDGVDRGVGHALGGANHALAQVVLDDLTAVVDLHDAGEHEAVELRAQAADVGREFEREHGHGAVGKVDTGAAQAGLLIEGTRGRDVLRDVGNVDLQLEIIVGQHADQDGVVEIAGSFAIDGNDRQSAEVATAAEFRAWDRRGHLLRFFERGRGKMMREMEFADDDFDVDAEVVFAAEDFDDASAGRLSGRGPVGDLYVDDCAFEVGPVIVAGDFVAEHAVDGLFLPLRPLRSLRFKLFCGRDQRARRGFRTLHSFRDHDFLGDLRVDGFDIVAAAAVVEDADNGGMGAVYRADDAALGPAVRTNVCDLR